MKVPVIMSDRVIHLVDLSLVDTPPLPWLDLLGEAEREWLGRVSIPRDRVSYAAAHALLRLGLGQRLPDVAPSQLDFTLSNYGKPLLAGGGPNFNISHTNGMAVVMVGDDQSVGVDVEHINPQIATRQLARDIYTPRECDSLDGAPDWSAAFTLLWCAKEAVIKADGRGIQLDLPGIRIAATDAYGSAGHWHLWQHQPTPDHCLVAAWRGDANPPELRPLSPQHLTEWALEAKK